MPTTDLTEATQRPAPRRVKRMDDDVPTKADILDDVRRGLKQAQAGEGRPARVVLEEIRRELAEDDDLR